MSTAELGVVRLSRELARNFSAQPGIDPADAMAVHIMKFWEPRMQTELLDLVRAGDSSLDPLAVAAARQMVTDDLDEDEVREPSGG